jgi:hypothetical protein
MSLVTITLSALDYVAYASVSEADAFLAVDPIRGDAWNALGADVKGKHLVAATRKLDQLRFKGDKTGGATQENAFPRTNLTYATGEAVAVDEAPLPVERATILIAGSIALGAAAALSVEGGSSRVKSVGAGTARVEFFRGKKGGPLADEDAFQQLMLSGLLAGQASSTLGAMVSGTDHESFFGPDGSNDYPLLRGF